MTNLKEDIKNVAENMIAETRESMLRVEGKKIANDFANEVRKAAKKLTEDLEREKS